jgi:hypothetical protein
MSCAVWGGGAAAGRAAEELVGEEARPLRDKVAKLKAEVEAMGEQEAERAWEEVVGEPHEAEEVVVGEAKAGGVRGAWEKAKQKMQQVGKNVKHAVAGARDKVAEAGHEASEELQHDVHVVLHGRRQLDMTQIPLWRQCLMTACGGVCCGVRTEAREAYNQAKVRAMQAMNKATQLLMRAGEGLSSPVRESAVVSMREALHYAEEAERHAKQRLDHLRAMSRDQYDRTKVPPLPTPPPNLHNLMVITWSVFVPHRSRLLER